MLSATGGRTLEVFSYLSMGEYMCLYGNAEEQCTEKTPYDSPYFSAFPYLAVGDSVCLGL